MDKTLASPKIAEGPGGPKSDRASADQAEAWSMAFLAARHGDAERLAQLMPPNPDQRRSREGKTLLLAACDEGQSAVAAMLLDAGAHIDAVDQLGRGSLCLAVGAGNANTLALLLNRGASMETRQRGGQTPLMVAIGLGERSMASVLAARGADPNARDDNGWTPLMYAASHGAQNLALELLALGADPLARNDFKERASDHARASGFGRLAEMIEAHAEALELRSELSRAPSSGTPSPRL